MAIEWSKGINFWGLIKHKSLPIKNGYPSKTYINLVIPDEREEVGRRGIFTAVVAVLVLLLFGKFGVYDYFARVMAKNNELVQKTSELSTYKVELADYNDVLATYNSYEAVRMTNSAADVALVDVFELVDEHIRPVATVSSLEKNGNVLMLLLSDISLDEVSSLVGDLHQQPIVSTVEVKTAASSNETRDGVDTVGRTVQLTLTLQSTAAAQAEVASSSSATTTTSGS